MPEKIRMRGRSVVVWTLRPEDRAGGLSTLRVLGAQAPAALAAPGPAENARRGSHETQGTPSARRVKLCGHRVDQTFRPRCALARFAHCRPELDRPRPACRRRAEPPRTWRPSGNDVLDSPLVP